MSVNPVSGERLIAPARHIFLSPHYDDIALSCGGTACRIAEASKSPEVALIFGDHPDPAQPMTTFAKTLHRQWGLDAEQVIAGRRAEEAVAAKALGTKAVFLPFRDAIYRGRRYLDDDQLFGTPAEDEADLPEAIIAALHIGDEQTRIYAPLAVGFHVDHQHAFRAGVALAGRGHEVWFYEDLPYALVPGARMRRTDAIAESIAPTILVDVTGQWEQKIDAICAYQSQLTTIFQQYVGVGTTRAEISDAMARYARDVGNGTLCERFWTIKADG